MFREIDWVVFTWLFQIYWHFIHLNIYALWKLFTCKLFRCCGPELFKISSQITCETFESVTHRFLYAKRNVIDKLLAALFERVGVHFLSRSQQFIEIILTAYKNQHFEEYLHYFQIEFGSILFEIIQTSKNELLKRSRGKTEMNLHRGNN